MVIILKLTVTYYVDQIFVLMYVLVYQGKTHPFIKIALKTQNETLHMCNGNAPLPKGHRNRSSFMTPSVNCFSGDLLQLSWKSNGLREVPGSNPIGDIAFFSATIDGRNLIFGHKLHIGTPYRTHQIPTSCLPIFLIFIHI